MTCPEIWPTVNHCLCGGHNSNWGVRDIKETHNGVGVVFYPTLHSDCILQLLHKQNSIAAIKFLYSTVKYQSKSNMYHKNSYHSKQRELLVRRIPRLPSPPPPPPPFVHTSIGQKWGGGLFSGSLHFRVMTIIDHRMPRGHTICVFSMAV